MELVEQKLDQKNFLRTIHLVIKVSLYVGKRVKVIGGWPIYILRERDIIWEVLQNTKMLLQQGKRRKRLIMAVC